MKAEEIRAMQSNQILPSDSFCLLEIAVQLAEIKELLDSGKNGQANLLVWPGEPITALVRQS